MVGIDLHFFRVCERQSGEFLESSATKKVKSSQLRGAILTRKLLMLFFIIMIIDHLEM